MNYFNETSSTFFQVKPKNFDTDAFFGSRWCMFMNNAFDLGTVTHVSQVVMKSKMCYQFIVTFMNDVTDVSINNGAATGRQLTFECEAKRQALLAHRELVRALTRTGEFAKETSDGNNTGDDRRSVSDMAEP